MESIATSVTSTPNVYLHFVKNKDGGGSEWQERYFLSEQDANNLPKVAECKHEEPSLVAVLHDITESKFFRLRGGQEIHVE